MDSRDDRIESYYQESARDLAERIVDLEDEAAELNRLNIIPKEDSKVLARLEAAGVDNWEGYSHAFEDEDE